MRGWFLFFIPVLLVFLGLYVLRRAKRRKDVYICTLYDERDCTCTPGEEEKR